MKKKSTNTQNICLSSNFPDKSIYTNNESILLLIFFYISKKLYFLFILLNNIINLE